MQTSHNQPGASLAAIALKNPDFAMKSIIADGNVQASLRSLRAFPDALVALRRADSTPVSAKQSIEDLLEMNGVKWMT